MSYSNLSKCCKKKMNEKYEETKTNFEGAYLNDGLADLAQI